MEEEGPFSLIFLTIVFLLRAPLHLQTGGIINTKWNVKTAGYILLYCFPLFVLQLFVIFVGGEFKSSSSSSCTYPLLSTLLLGLFALINFVLSALPIYLLSFIRIPKKVVHKIVSIQRNFLWGAHQEARKIPWVKWDIVCLPKSQGGLGIKDLSLFNEALLGKWGWQLANDHNQPWSRILTSKYGGWKELISGGRRNNSSQWWQDLKIIFQQQHNNCLSDNFKWRVGTGSNIRFWKDIWLENNCDLQGRYPQLYLISKQQHSSISSMGDFVEGRWE